MTIEEELIEISETAKAIATAMSVAGDSRSALSALSTQLSALLAHARINPQKLGYEAMSTAQRVQYVKNDTDTYRGLLDDLIREFRTQDTDSRSQPVESKPV